MTPHDYIKNQKNIKLLASPPGINDIEFDTKATQKVCICKIFVEVKVGIAPEWTQSLVNNMEAHHKKYGLKHYVTGTIHRAMVTLYLAEFSINVVH